MARLAAHSSFAIHCNVNRRQFQAKETSHDYYHEKQKTHHFWFGSGAVGFSLALYGSGRVSFHRRALLRVMATQAAPLDLTSGLGPKSPARAGDVILLMGGTYEGGLNTMKQRVPFTFAVSGRAGSARAGATGRRCRGSYKRVCRDCRRVCGVSRSGDR